MFNLWGIRKNILVLVLTPMILVSLVLSVYFVLDRIETLENGHVAKGKVMLSSISLLAQAISIDNKQDLQKQISRFRDSDPDILAIAILGSDNSVIIYSGNNSFIEQLAISVYPDAYADKIVNGSLRMVTPIMQMSPEEPVYLSILLNRQPLILESYHSILMASILAISILSISLYIALYLSKAIGMPLQKISEELEAINEGKLDVKLHTPVIPELAKISNTINSLANSLHLSRDNMQHNIDQATSDLTQTLETIEIQNIELDMARKQAIQASRVKSEFLANISHEIRTPMNGVIGFTNLLLNSSIDITQKDYLLTIRKSANNLLSIIEDILDFSKIEAGKMTLDKMSYSLRDCVEEVVTMLSPSSVKKNIELIPLIYRNVPEQMLGDPIRVRQILTNLISNAIKFTEKGSIVVRILLEDEDVESQIIRTTITDTGIGMTDEQLSKLFQPFSQVNQQINRHHSGTGLGLVICKKLVEQMGGEIHVESKSNEGTSFSFTLRSEKLSQQNTNEGALVDLKGQPVMLFDPHPMALLAMKQLLSSWNMDVHDFQSIDKLLSALKKLCKDSSFNPVIMLGLLEQQKYIIDAINEITKYNHRGLFILGHSMDYYDIDNLYSLGVNQYFEKPLTRKQLKKSFESLNLIPKPENLLTISEPKNDEQLNHQFSQLRILTVDDNPANLKLISIVLEEMSIDVIQAYDGLSAFEICNEEHFDLIFMDIRMPGIDGIETSQKIRKESINQRTPIIAFTAHAMAGEKEQLLSKGLDDYMTKPASTYQLIQIISKWTGQIATVATDEHAEIKTVEYDSDDESISWSTCLYISGDREDLAREMLADLVSSIPKFQSVLKETLATSELLTIVHKFHGLACYTGVIKLKNLTSELEQLLKENANEDCINRVKNQLSDELILVESKAKKYINVD